MNTYEILRNIRLYLYDLYDYYDRNVTSNSSDLYELYLELIDILTRFEKILNGGK